MFHATSSPALVTLQGNQQLTNKQQTIFFQDFSKVWRVWTQGIMEWGSFPKLIKNITTKQIQFMYYEQSTNIDTVQHMKVKTNHLVTSVVKGPFCNELMGGPLTKERL